MTGAKELQLKERIQHPLRLLELTQAVLLVEELEVEQEVEQLRRELFKASDQTSMAEIILLLTTRIANRIFKASSRTNYSNLAQKNT